MTGYLAVEQKFKSKGLIVEVVVVGFVRDRFPHFEAASFLELP